MTERKVVRWACCGEPMVIRAKPHACRQSVTVELQKTAFRSGKAMPTDADVTKELRKRQHPSGARS